MTKEELLKEVAAPDTQEGRNSMGVSESFYNPFYLIKTANILPEDLTNREADRLALKEEILSALEGEKKDQAQEDYDRVMGNLSGFNAGLTKAQEIIRDKIK